MRDVPAGDYDWPAGPMEELVLVYPNGEQGDPPASAPRWAGHLWRFGFFLPQRMAREYTSAPKP